MIIRTAQKTKNFTVIPNKLIDDSSLDWRDIGLLIYLLSKPDNWQASVSHLVKQKKSGRSIIYKILKVLKKAGYAKTKRLSSGEMDWYIYDEPHPENTDQAKPHTEKPHVEKPHVDIRTLIRTDKTIRTDIKQKEKEKKEKYPLSKKENWEIPDWINKTAWSEFEQHRKEIRKPLTNLGRTKAANQLKGLDHKQQQLCIDYSIAGRYQGLFPEKGKYEKAIRKNSDTRSRAKRVSDKLDEIAKRDIEENGFTEFLG